MRNFAFAFLFIALTGVLLVREQESGTFDRIDARIFEKLAVRYLPKNPVVTMVRHNEQSADISGSAQLTEIDMALFLRTALKFSAASVGIAGDMATKSENPLAADILTTQTHRNANVYFGVPFSPKEENAMSYFKPPNRIAVAENVPFRFAGFPFPPKLPKNATIGFLNIDEKAARKNLVPMLALYRDIPVGSFALTGLLVSGTLAESTAVSPGIALSLPGGRVAKIDPAGFFRIQEGADALIKSVTLDELLLEMEKFESDGKSEKLDSLLSGRMIVLGRDGEKDRTVVLASGRKYSPLHVQALTIASFIAGKIVTPISPWWNLLLLLPVAVFLPLLKNAKAGVRALFTPLLFLIPAVAIIGLHAWGLWLSPAPLLGMTLAFLLAIPFLPSAK